MHLPDIVRNSMPSAVTDSVRRAKQYVTHVDTVQGARESSAEDKKQKARKTALAEPLHDDVDDLVRNVTPGTYLRARKALKAASACPVCRYCQSGVDNSHSL
jgi:type IV secretory pathway TrbF-like protein